MTYRKTFTLNNEAVQHLEHIGANNMSAYINSLLLADKKQKLEEAILKANKEEAEEAYQQELNDWDITLSDGI